MGELTAVGAAYRNIGSGDSDDRCLSLPTHSHLGTVRRRGNKWKQVVAGPAGAYQNRRLPETAYPQPWKDAPVRS